MIKHRIGKTFPWLYEVRVRQLQWACRWADRRSGVRFARVQRQEPLASITARHRSVLRRRLAGTDPQLQENKIVNLRLSLPLIDGLVLRPGETFSFWDRIGRTTPGRGYAEGLMLSRGEVRSGPGGGLCQLANLLFWLGLHSSLTVAERHHHSFDLFPDERRTVPFGSGTSVFYNYVDLRLRNDTEREYQFRVWLTDEYLAGELRSSSEEAWVYRVEERKHRFFERGGRRYRSNEIWRLRLDRSGQQVLGEEKLLDNLAEVRYRTREGTGMEQQG
ncbi:VanW family protein [Paenibacillus caseinilyticus]|uniref:Vancomycin B-type resistance protein n=1 Tax=Paenibacillus mucilaginosus K02 TaxID=997761 RepID=I0BET0_9BACL|nr:VanW family protein [Paenibacillus mucilaginosus]AFH60877.1 vancomycin B-type resistance protein [Paenibacillus mucilaginosus K02]